MLAALTFAVAASLALHRLLEGASARTRAVAHGFVTLGVMADSWMERLPLHDPPPFAALPAGIPSGAAVVELPLGIFEDAAAMYRSMYHGHPLVNGLSGYQPPLYSRLRLALVEGRFEALEALAHPDGLVILVNREAAGPDMASAIRARTRASALPGNRLQDVLWIAAPAAAQDQPGGSKPGAR
jgi:hypothetical protein